MIKTNCINKTLLALLKESKHFPFRLIVIMIKKNKFHTRHLSPAFLLAQFPQTFKIFTDLLMYLEINDSNKTQ